MEMITVKEMITEVTYEGLNEVLGLLEGQSVEVSFENKMFSPLYSEEFFYGYVSDDAVFIGDLNYCVRIEKSNIIGIEWTVLGNSISVVIGLLDGSVVRVWN